MGDLARDYKMAQIVAALGTAGTKKAAHAGGFLGKKAA